jgi:putative membrane protein
VLLSAVAATVARADSHLPDSSDIWKWWVPDPLAIIVFGGLGYLYFRGLRDWKKRSRPHGRWKIASFYVGLLLFLASLVSPLDPLSDQLFLMHMIQHVIIRAIGPILIILGAPVTPVLRGLPIELRMGLIAPLVSSRTLRKAYSIFQHPVLMPGLFVIVLFFWALPEFHDAAVENFWIHYVMHLSMSSTGLLFWWLIIDPKPHRSKIHYGPRILIMGLTLFPNTTLGAIITFSESIQYKAYGVDRLWGIAPLDDQKGGALIQWFAVDMMALAAAIVIFAMWYQRERADDRRRLQKRLRAQRLEHPSEPSISDDA